MTSAFAANFQNREISSASPNNPAREALLADAFVKSDLDMQRYNASTYSPFLPTLSNYNSSNERSAPTVSPTQEKNSKDSSKSPSAENKQEKETNKKPVEPQKLSFKQEVLKELYAGVNRIKAKHGEEQLDLNQDLAHKALLNSKKGFGHHGFHKGRENAAWAPRQSGETAKHYANRILKMWMNSPGHRANLLAANSKEMGIGISGTTITLALA